MNIEILQGQFKTNDNLSFDATDPRLDEIATLAQAEEFSEAARLSEVILTSGIYDIRLICYFLYGYWQEQGIVGLIDVIDCLNNVIVKNWEVLGPINKREKIFEKSLDWMLKKILKKVEYEERKNSSLWQKWVTDINADHIEQILRLGGMLCLSLSHQLEDKSWALIDQWGKIEQWLRVFKQLECQPTIEPESELDATEVLDSLTIEEIVPAKIINAPIKTGLVLESSYHMDLLLRKLSAFEQLIEEEQFPKAALIAQDINQTVSNFDPKLYFPNVFETFVRLQAVNFEELTTHAYQRDEQHWEMMQDWLKVDIDSFIKS